MFVSTSVELFHPQVGSSHLSEEYIVKKVVRGMSLLVACSLVCGSAMAGGIVSINSREIFEMSEEGRRIQSLNEKARKEVMDVELEQSKDVSKVRDEIEQLARTGQREKIQAKYIELGHLQRKAEFKIKDAREVLKMKEQERVFAFREKVHGIAGEVFKDDIVFDRATPGMISAPQSSDKTKVLLKELNDRFQKEKATLMLTKASTEEKKDKKTA